MRLVLIRHGQTPANVAGVLSTDAPGPGLTELGHEQAEAVPAAVAQERIAGLFVSTLVRTHLTAAPLAAARSLDPVQLPGLHEIEAGDLEGRSDWPSIERYLTTVFSWRDGDLDARMPGGPSGIEFFDRFDASVADIHARIGDGTAAVVSHGAAIRTWVGGRSRNIRPAYAAEHELDNTGVVIVEGDPATGWTLISWAGEPVGGDQLADSSAADPTGEPV